MLIALLLCSVERCQLVMWSFLVNSSIIFICRKDYSETSFLFKTIIFSVLKLQIKWSLSLDCEMANTWLFFFLRFYLFMWQTASERGNRAGEWERKKQAPSRGARCGIRSRNAGIRAWAKGRRLMTALPRHPFFFFFLTYEESIRGNVIVLIWAFKS